MIAQHSSKSAEHYTPVGIVEKARKTLGTIDLDPASCALANEVVRATRWFDDGLRAGWHGRVFLNPPGGKLHKDTLEPVAAGPGVSAAAVWWDRLWRAWDAGHVEAAVFVCFSLAVFRTGQARVKPPYAFPFCVLRERLDYDKPDESGRRVASKGAPADSAIVLLPPHVPYVEAGAMVRRFAAEFSPLGYVRL